MPQSKKPIKPLSECTTQKLFIVPRERVNDIDPITGEKCLFVQINGKPHYIPVDKPTPISYNAFCVLRELNIIDYTYKEGAEFNPL